jgi:hypothetical protein
MLRKARPVMLSSCLKITNNKKLIYK